jgi:hypothetical protein
VQEIGDVSRFGKEECHIGGDERGVCKATINHFEELTVRGFEIAI